MGSFNACKYNNAYKVLYDRIVTKGKSKKLALLAVYSKLLKQAFAAAKARSILVNNLVNFICFSPQFFVVHNF